MLKYRKRAGPTDPASANCYVESEVHPEAISASNFLLKFVSGGVSELLSALLLPVFYKYRITTARPCVGFTFFFPYPT